MLSRMCIDHVFTWISLAVCLHSSVYADFVCETIKILFIRGKRMQLKLSCQNSRAPYGVFSIDLVKKFDYRSRHNRSSKSFLFESQPSNIPISLELSTTNNSEQSNQKLYFGKMANNRKYFSKWSREKWKRFYQNLIVQCGCLEFFLELNRGDDEYVQVRDVDDEVVIDDVMENNRPIRRPSPRMCKLCTKLYFITYVYIY